MVKLSKTCSVSTQKLKKSTGTSAICENALISPFKPVFGALGTVDIDAKTLAAVLTAFKGRGRIESTVENTGSAILLQIYEVGDENKQAAICCEREASLE